MTKRQQRGWLLVLLGLSMVLASLLMHTAHQRQDDMAGENAEVLLQQLQLSQMSLATESETDAPRGPALMPEKDYLGYSMIGTLRIPDLAMELPILSSWSYDLLELAPCRFSGSLPGGDMILMGHNYKGHFTPLHRISPGTGVEFEDVNGVVTRFTVVQTEILHKNQIDRLYSEHPLSLFTCTASGSNRFVVRCAEANGSGL